MKISSEIGVPLKPTREHAKRICFSGVLFLPRVAYRPSQEAHGFREERRETLQEGVPDDALVLVRIAHHLRHDLEMGQLVRGG